MSTCDRDRKKKLTPYFVFILFLVTVMVVSALVNVKVVEPIDSVGNVKVNVSWPLVDNDLPVFNQNNWGDSVALGDVDGIEFVFKFCNNPEVGNSQEVLWDFGGVYTFLNTSERLDISSTSATDNGYTNDTGAWDILVFGLDENYNEIVEYLVLNGTTPVTTAQSFLRTYRAFILRSGLATPILDSNEGEISIQGANTSTLQAFIQQYNGQTEMCIYTVPAGKTAILKGLTVSAGEGRSILYKTRARNCGDPQCTFSTKYSVQLYQNIFADNLPSGLQIPEKTDIVSTVESDLPGGTPVSASVNFYLVENE